MTQYHKAKQTRIFVQSGQGGAWRACTVVCSKMVIFCLETMLGIEISGHFGCLCARLLLPRGQGRFDNVFPSAFLIQVHSPSLSLHPPYRCDVKNHNYDTALESKSDAPLDCSSPETLFEECLRASEEKYCRDHVCPPPL